MMEIITKLINELTGIDFWIAASALIIVLARWWYLSKTKKAEQKIAKRQISFAVVMTVIAVLAIAVPRLFFSPDYTFPDGVTGILVLRIEGDDEKNSLQRDWVSTLNTNLSQEAPEQKIEVRAYNKTVSENMGLLQAHMKAREIGKDCNALLVIWGIRIGEKKFHPRLTIVEDKSHTVILGEKTLSEQIISDVGLPVEQANAPIHIIHFIAGFISHSQKNYRLALTHFETVLSRPTKNPAELNDVRFYIGNCHAHLAERQNNNKKTWHLERSIAHFDTVLNFFTEQNFPEKWAKTQINIGCSYGELPTGDHAENLKNAITAFESALRVFNERTSPDYWAGIQNNLGASYLLLSSNNDGKNIEKAIASLQNALRVHTEKEFPVEWARIQLNIGAVYARFPTGDTIENLRKAIAALEAALRIFTEKDYPLEWAKSWHNLGVVYEFLPSNDRNANLLKAQIAYDTTLRVYTETNFPEYWAMTQKSLGKVYMDLSANNRNENYQKAINAYESAVRVYTEKEFPAEWASIQQNLGEAYGRILTNRKENLTKAILACKSAIRVYKEDEFPIEWARTSVILGNAYSALGIGDWEVSSIDTTGGALRVRFSKPLSNSSFILKAIQTYEEALRVYTEKGFPTEWATVMSNLGPVYAEFTIGNRLKNLRKAIACLENALKIHTEEAFPDDYKATKGNLERAQSLLRELINKK